MIDNQLDAIKKLELEVQKELKTLKPLAGIRPNNLLEITRCIDYYFCVINFALPKRDPSYLEQHRIFKLLTIGLYDALQVFVEKEIENHGEFYALQSNIHSMAWARVTLNKTAMVALTKRHISLVQSKVFKIEQSRIGFTFTCILPNIWHELIDSGHSKWLLQYKANKNLVNDRLLELEPIAESLLTNNISILDAKPVQHPQNAVLDEYFFLIGAALCKAMVGYDTLPAGSVIGGILYTDMQAIIQSLVGIAEKHTSLCAAYQEIRGKDEIKSWNYYTLTFRLRALVRYISTQASISPETVEKVLSILIIDKINLGAHLGIPSASLPPLIRTNKDTILLSIAGVLNNPFTFLLRSLKFHFQKDFDRVVQEREITFRQEFNDLFDGDNFIKSHTRINLELGSKTLTDIDAMVYSQKEKILWIVQLKWADDFGTSMQMRFSAGKNFYNKSKLWIDQIDKWLHVHDAPALIERITKKRLRLEVNKTYKVIIARHIAHFSDQEKDERATWCSWPELVRTIKTQLVEKITLKELIRALDQSSPERIAQNYGERPTSQYQLGKYLVTIKY